MDPAHPGILTTFATPSRPSWSTQPSGSPTTPTFTNNGAGATWTAFDMPGTGYQTAVALTDPTTGLPRLIFGSDTGIWSVLDDNGTFETAIGGTQNGDPTPGINRNGNLQLAQFYYGAAQPSTAAAQAAGALFYGGAQNLGAVSSTGSILTTGNLGWSINGAGQLQSGAGVATDQQGSGTAFNYLLPYEGGNYAYTNFFQVDGVGRTFGLFQASGGQPTPDPQWAPQGVANFALNPVNDSDAVISSSTGRIFSTTNEGVTWFDIGDPAVFGSPTGYSVALGLRCPRPNRPRGSRQPGQLHLRRHPERPDLRHPGWRRQRDQQQLDQYFHWPGRLGRRADHHRPGPRQPRGLRRHRRWRLLHGQLDPLGQQPDPDLGQHHRQSQDPGLLHLRPELRPHDATLSPTTWQPP